MSRSRVLGLILMLVLGGCATERAPRERVTIHVWSGWTGQEGKSFQALCDAFNRAQPRIFVHNLGGVSDDTKVIRAITAGAPPDAFTIWNSANVGPLAAYGALRNLDGPFRASGLREADLVPGALRLCKYEDHFIGVPLLMDTMALLWNKQAFREAGLDPEKPPRTLQEMKAAAVRLTRFNGKGEVVRLGLQLPDTTLLCWVHGGEFLDPKTGAPTANHPENVRALEYYRGLVEAMGGRARVQAFGSGFGQRQGPNHPFFVGKVAMMISGEWIPSWIEKYSPGLEYGVAPVPYDARRPDRRGATLIAVNMLAIPAEAKHPREAWEFLRWLQRPEVQTRFAQALNNVPNIRAALDDPELTTGSPRKRNFGRFCRIAQYPNARGFPVTPVGQLYLDELGHATEFVLFGAKTPQEALDGVQAKLSKEVDRLKIAD